MNVRLIMEVVNKSVIILLETTAALVIQVIHCMMESFAQV